MGGNQYAGLPETCLHFVGDTIRHTKALDAATAGHAAGTRGAQ